MCRVPHGTTRPSAIHYVAIDQGDRKTRQVAAATPTTAPNAFHEPIAMSRKTGRNKRVQLFDRGNTAYPVCLAALTNRRRFPVTVDVMGKRDTFMLSREGEALTTPFRGYSRRDWEKLDNSPSRKFTMSFSIPNRAGVAASAVKAAYLALFSLLGRGPATSISAATRWRPSGDSSRIHPTTTPSGNTSAKLRMKRRTGTSCWSASPSHAGS